MEIIDAVHSTVLVPCLTGFGWSYCQFKETKRKQYLINGRVSYQKLTCKSNLWKKTTP